MDGMLLNHIPVRPGTNGHDRSAGNHELRQFPSQMSSSET
jgi:hypothetical protein